MERVRLTRNADGSEWEVVTPGAITDCFRHGYRFVRMGPVGQPRWKRRWLAIDEIARDFSPSIFTLSGTPSKEEACD